MNKIHALSVLVLFAGCTDPSSAGPDVDSDSGSNVTVPEPVYRARWEPDGAAPVERELIEEGPQVVMVTGAGCAPSLILSGTAHYPESRIIDDRFQFDLYFPGPLQPGMAVALLDDPSPPGHTVPLSVEWERIVGGQVRVVTAEPARWEFRFEGDGLSICSDPVGGDWTCNPLAGGTLSFEPLDPAGALPQPDDVCFEGGPFPWPDGWDGCAVTESGYDLGTCPATSPW